MAAVRSSVDAFHDRYRQQAHSLNHTAVAVRSPAPACALCDRLMHVQKTTAHTGMTLAHGVFHVSETVHACPSRCRKDGQLVTARSSDLAKLLVPRSRVGYDVMAFVGRQRFLEGRQREEIRAELDKRYGIVLSTGEISALSRRFLVYLEALHRKAAPGFRAAFDADGGWPLHIDATGEDGRGTVVTAFAGWRGWVLHAWKVSTERADLILPGIQDVAATFGSPCAIMRDLGPAMIEATDAFVRSLDRPIPVLACHYHFLADIGEDLLKEGHNRMRDWLRKIKLLPDLRAFVRQLGRKLGDSIGDGRQALDTWLGASDHAHPLPDGVGGLTTVRSLAQWVLDYPADGSGVGFPFDRPWMNLYDRCLRLGAAIETFLRSPPADAKVRQALGKLQSLLRPVNAKLPAFTSIADSVRQRADLFDRLRAALRLEDKHEASSVETLQDVRAAIQRLKAALEEERPQRGPAKDKRQAIDVILAHLERHDSHLWGHAIARPDHAGGCVRLVARTNNDLENVFHTIKHHERRRSGRKILTQDFEGLPPTAMLVNNLRDPDYVHILCGSLDALPEAFSQLDAHNRARSIAASPLPAPTIAETASLSTTDKRLVRRPVFDNRVFAAAQCS